MNSDKQIDEMAKTMLEASQNANVEPVLEMEGKEVVLGENATKILNNILEQAYIPFLAEKLTDKGYRLASDVAREVIDEINDSFDQMVNEAENTIMNAIQEGNLTAARIARYGKDVIILARNTLTKMLEKKYTEGEG